MKFRSANYLIEARTSGEHHMSVGQDVGRPDIVERLRDLYRQATVDRSHYYTGRVVLSAIEEIEELRKDLAWQVREYGRLKEKLPPESSL